MRFIPHSARRTVYGFLALVAIFATFATTPVTAHAGQSPDAASVQEPYSSFATAAASTDPADAVCARQAAGSTVSSPAQLFSSNGVLETTFHFKTVVDQQGLTRYCYFSNTGYEAPTLRVNPGDQLIIHFENDLPASGSSVQSSSMPGMVMKGDATAAATSGCNATSVSSTSTNLHFHGLNVSPACGQDEVIHTIIQPQQTFDYAVQIPSNEPAGLYWYHPHPHGFSQPQVLGGATGVIVVQGIQNFNPIVAGLPERIFVIRDQALSNAELNTPGNQPQNDLSLNYIPVLYPNYVPAIIQTPPSKKEFWRVANTSANSLINLEVPINHVNQPLQIVAVDGVPVTDGSGNPTTTTQTNIVLPPGARVEFIVTTPAVGATAVLLAQGWNNGPQGDNDPIRTLATIVASASTTDGNLPVASVRAASVVPEVTQSIPLARFKALTNATPAAAAATVQRNLYFSIKPGFSEFYITVAGQTPAPFNMDGPPNIVVRSGTVEQWTISNQSLMDHAFHIHQIHFRTLAINGSPVTDYTERDTINVPHWSGSGAYPSVTLLMDFSDPGIVGTFVYHCHILSHEDLGMMGAIQVLPPVVSSKTTLTATPTGTTSGQNVLLQATITPTSSGPPTGSVTFYNGSTNIGTAALNSSGVAGLSTHTLPTGANSIKAVYTGDSNYTSSTSSLVTVTIGPAPQITALSRYYGAYAATVTITGTNFGATQGAGSVTFNGVKTGSTPFFNMTWSNTSINVIVPASATTGFVVVHANGQGSNGVTFTVYPTPVVTSLSPTAGPVGSTVTLTGSNLKDGGGNTLVTFGNYTGTILSQSSTSIQVKVPTGATTGPIRVHANGAGANSGTFTVN